MSFCIKLAENEFSTILKKKMNVYLGVEMPKSEILTDE